MKYFYNKFPGLLNAFLRTRPAKPPSDNQATDVLNTIESVIDGTDSKIRLVRGYRNKLRNTILSSLEFSEELVSQIPEPIEISSRTFVSDPYVNAFFTNVTDLQSIISHSSEIQDYLAESRDNRARCCALLCMQRTEKTVMGQELSGDILKKEVLQVAVNFTDHQIYSPAPSEPEARKGLKCCLFQGLVTNALERIMTLRLASHRLQNRHRILHSRLRHYQQKQASQGALVDNKITQAIEETSRELGEVEKQILGTPLITPQVALDQVIDVFGKPQDFIRISKTPLRLNKMCIKVDEDSPGPVNELNLTEVFIGSEPPRVVTLARFPEKDMLATTVFTAPRQPGPALN